MKMEKRGEESFNKKGQVTVFIIVGILIVIIAGILIYVNKEKVGVSQFTSVQIEPVREYLRECTTAIVKDDLNKIRKNGGYLKRDNKKVLDCGEVLIVDRNRNDAQSMIGLNNILVNDIKERVINECGLVKEFGDQFTFVNTNNFDVDINFNDETVDVTLDYSINIIRGNSNLNIGKITVSVKDDIRKVIALVGKIGNDVFIGISYTNKDILDILNVVNYGQDHDNTRLNEYYTIDNVLGNGCSFGDCKIDCYDNFDGSGSCCSVKNKFFDENEIELFRFAVVK